MTIVPGGPHGTDVPDGLLAAYANGSLSLAERAEVEQWLAMHPTWTGRLELYWAIGGAVRGSAARAGAPAIASMAGLWATIDAEPQPDPPPHPNSAVKSSRNSICPVAPG